MCCSLFLVPQEIWAMCTSRDGPLGLWSGAGEISFLALVPRERPTLAFRLLPCGYASYRISIPMPKSDQSLLSSSLTHLGATLESPALFLFPGWSPEMGAFSKCTVVGKHCFFPCLRGSGMRGLREEEQDCPGASSVHSAAALRALVLSSFQLCPAHSCLGEFIHSVAQWHFDAYKCQP